jgi:hypothetical protein
MPFGICSDHIKGGFIMTLYQLLEHIELDANVELYVPGQKMWRTDGHSLYRSPYLYKEVKDFVVLDMFKPGTLAAIQIYIKGKENE